MMKTYQVGDRVWWAHCGVREVTETCAICAGQREVTLILGDGTARILPCEYCGTGYEGPRGYTTDHEYIAAPELIVISDVTVHCGPEGERREYRGEGCWCLDPSDIFDTLAEAEARAIVRAAEFATMCDAQKQDRRKHHGGRYSWRAGYHMREAQKARRELEHHERMARVCKDKSRTPAGAGPATDTEER